MVGGKKSIWDIILMGLFSLLGIIVILLGTHSCPGIEFWKKLNDSIYVIHIIDYRIRAVFVIIGIIIIVHGIKQAVEK